MFRTMLRTIVLVIVALGAFARPAAADLVQVVLRDGGVYDGVLVRETKDEVVVKLPHCTLAIGRAEVGEVKRLGPAPAPGVTDARLPGWAVVFDRALRLPEAQNVRQIPATVIDEGILRHVPYVSHRFGSFELNIYGDPEEPACVEVGIVRGRPMPDEAKRQCLRLMCEILTNVEDRRVVESLSLRGPDELKARDLTFEITPPEAEDAFGGWWISVYDVAKLDAARATADELRVITTTKDAQRARDRLAWKPEDHAQARPGHKRKQPDAPRGASEGAPADAGAGGERVYVRGYHRRDGKYVDGSIDPAPPR